MKNNYGFEPIPEQIADSIRQKMPESMSITDFAKAVAYILAEDYGSGVYGQFLLTFKETLNNLD